ncbi:MAG: heme exporter protein CcmD [Candidatus Nanopelagicales bacterium]
MSGAAKSNVLIFLSAMFAFMTIWVGIAAVGGSNVLYGIAAVVLAVGTVFTFRAYRRLLRQLDAEERQS